MIIQPGDLYINVVDEKPGADTSPFRLQLWQQDKARVFVPVTMIKIEKSARHFHSTD